MDSFTKSLIYLKDSEKLMVYKNFSILEKNILSNYCKKIYNNFKIDNIDLSVKILSVKILFQYIAKNKKHDNIIYQCLNLAKYKYGKPHQIIEDIDFMNIPIFTVYDFIIFYTDNLIKYRINILKNLNVFFDTYPEIINQDPSKMAILLILFSIQDNNERNNLLLLSGHSVDEIDNMKNFFRNIKNTINVQIIIAPRQDFFDNKQINVITFDSFKPIYVKKYNIFIDYYKTNNQIEMLDTKEEILKISNFLSNQNTINSNHYKLIIERLIKINDIFLSNELLFLTVQILNRYIYLTPNIKYTDLQLIAISCLNIAYKNEINEFLTYEQLAQLIYNSSSKKDIVKMENDILITLKYDINIPTIYDFLLLYNINSNEAIIEAKKIITNSNSINVLPSNIASIIFYKLNKTWNNNMIKLTKYKIKDL